MHIAAQNRNIITGGQARQINIKDYEEYELLGETRDDAAGEAFDKGAD